MKQNVSNDIVVSATCEDQLLLNECRANLAAAGFRGHIALEANPALSGEPSTQAYGSDSGARIVRRSAFGGLVGAAAACITLSFFDLGQPGLVVTSISVAGAFLGAVSVSSRRQAHRDRFSIRCRGDKAQVDLAQRVLGKSPCRNLQRVAVDPSSRLSVDDNNFALASAHGDQR